MDIKPIETRYRGYRFRSRLEARWAVFFDALGIEWEYEKEGYVLPDGSTYLPDFYMPSYSKIGDHFIEVKGVPNEGDINRVELLVKGLNKIVIIVCDFEALSDAVICLPRANGEGVYYIYTRTYDAIYNSLNYQRNELLTIGSDEYEQAVTAAKSARFEHGESPTF